MATTPFDAARCGLLLGALAVACSQAPRPSIFREDASGDLGASDRSLTDGGAVDRPLDNGGPEALCADLAPAGSLGLRELGALVELPVDRFGTPHGSQLLAPAALPGTLFIADSFGGFLRYQTSASRPSLTFHSDRTLPAGTQTFCSQIALHVASATVYCVGFYQSGVALFDADSGAYRATAGAGDEGYISGAALHGDGLYLAAMQRGLWRRPVLTDGSLGPSVRVAEGAFVGVLDLPAGVVALDRDRGLFLLPDRGAPATIALPGPPLAAHVNGGEVAVALGSQGVALVTLATGAVQHLAVGCMASAVDATADALLVGCRQGLRLYARPAPAATRLGPLLSSTRASFSISDVLAVGADLYALDWRYLQRFEATTDPVARGLPDAPLGFTIPAGRGVRYEVVNPFDAPLTVQGRSLGAGERARFFVAGGATHLALEACGGPGVDIGVDTVNDDLVAPGGLLGLPYANARVYLLQPDCALQWSDLEDLRWLAMHGGLGDGRDLRVVMTPSGTFEDLSWLQAAWSPLPMANLHDLLPLADLPGRDYDAVLRRLDLARRIGGPDSTLFVATDAARRVVTMANQYNGAFGLAVEAADAP